jgi:hypothetical protein
MILKRICSGLFVKLLFKLIAIIGFVLFAFAFWIIKVTVLERIDTKYWDNLKSDQFKSFEQLNQGKR